MTVEWPDRRLDVLCRLDHLAAEPVHDEHGRDPRWPDLTNAVHWVVDDTWWDHPDPVDSVGTLLVDDAEAAAVARVVREIVAVADRRQPGDTDRAWFMYEAWPRVSEAAAAALMRGNNA